MSDNGEFVRSMENATIRMIQQMLGKVDKACLVIEADAKARCPKDLGILAASIQSETSLGAGEIVGSIGSNLEYAPYVHQGTGIYAKDGNGRKTPWCYVVEAGKYKGGHITVGQRPQPFLDDAKKAKKGTVERILGDG